jgi:sulfatase maturation enzyme AslB (radical SAM superfamily)
MKKLKWILYRLKWHAAPYINFSAPVHVDIELTSRCNLKCTFCHQQDRKYEIGDMSFEMVDKIIDECGKIGVKSVKFNWRGEVTQPSLPLLLAITNSYNNGLFTYLNTNLSCQYGIETIQAIAANFDVLKVSIDTIDNPLYCEIRKGARFTRTMKNLIKLAEYRKKYKMPPIIISRRTLDGMESDKVFKSYFKQFGKFKFDIRPAMPRNSNMKKQKERKRKYCGQPSRRIVIGWDGQAWPCCVAYNEPDILDMGNVEDEGIFNIWDGTFRQALIQRLKKNDFRNLDCCKNCTSSEAYK